MKYLIPILFVATPVLADTPRVEEARASQSGSSWRFDVTLSHPDTGWDHYADGWRVELPSGEVLGFRELLHPHVNEQPFTRSLSGVDVPEGAKTLHIRARDNADGWAKDVFILQLD